MALIYRLEQSLEHLGTVHNRNFEREISEILEGLISNDTHAFEAAQVRLGNFLGYDARKEWKRQAAPDPFWIADDSMCFVFEDHAEAGSAGALDVRKARQVATHPNWIRASVELGDGAIVLPVLVTPVVRADAEALPHLTDVALWPLQGFGSGLGPRSKWCGI